jgi:hypothetical protein
MVWQGYWSRVCKCNGFNENRLFGRDRHQLDQKINQTCPQCGAVLRIAGLLP